MIQQHDWSSMRCCLAIVLAGLYSVTVVSGRHDQIDFLTVSFYLCANIAGPQRRGDVILTILGNF